MLTAQVKIPDVSDLSGMVGLNMIFSSFQAESKQQAIKAETLKKKETVFLYQIKKAESLYNPIIFKAAKAHDLDVALVKAIIMAESGYNSNSVSKYGASGLMQLMPATARALGVKDILDPEENIHAGVKYYKSLLDRFNDDTKLALAAYNAGARNVRKYMGIPPFRETRKFISKVLEYQRFYQQGPIKEEEISS